MTPQRRTPLNKVWGDSIKKTAPQAPEWPVKPAGDLGTFDALEALKEAAEHRPVEEPVVIVEDKAPAPAQPTEELEAKPRVRRVVYSMDAPFKVAKMMGRSAKIMPTLSIHNFMPGE